MVNEPPSTRTILKLTPLAVNVLVLWFVGVAPACMTDMVCDKLLAFTVIVALREDVEVFSVTLTVIVPLSEPEDELTLHQV